MLSLVWWMVCLGIAAPGAATAQSGDPAPGARAPAPEAAKGSEPKPVRRVLTTRTGAPVLVAPEESGSIEAIAPKHQIPARAPAAPTDPLVLEKVREVAAARGEDKGLTFLPYTPAPLMPYLDSVLMFGNTCIQPDPVFESDPLSTVAQKAKSALAEAGLEYSFNQAYLLSVTSDRLQGDAVLNSYSFKFLGDWKIFRTTDANAWVRLGVNGGTGLGVNWTEQSPGGNIGAFNSPADVWYAKDLWIPELAWGMSFADGQFAVVAGQLNQSNYFDDNTYSNTGYGQLLNDAFINSTVLPMPGNNLGVNVEWQPSNSFYAMFGASATNQAKGQSPFVDLSISNMAYPLEFGFIQDDSFGLGRGVLRVQPFLATFEGSTGAGLCLNIEQKLGKESPLGVFGRFGLCEDSVAPIGGAGAEAAFGVAAIGPFPGRSNDYAGLGLQWTREAVTRSDEVSLELTYALQLTATMLLQPDIQVVFNPANNPSSDPIVLFQFQITMQW